MTTSLPGGEARRLRPSGLRAGRRAGRLEGPADALALVADDLVAAEEALRRLVVSDVAAVPHVAAYLLDSGGKRLRPALTALGARAAGLRGSIAELACCGELIHLGSLLHDDVVDQGELRRGRPAAQVVWGNAVAVLTGDFCVARALLAASRHGGARAAEQLAETVTEMAVGEVVQLQHAGDLDNDLATYLSVVERKTASLIGWCAAAGAWSSGDEAAADALQAYGRKLGVAFQITDDVLDYHDDTGKQPGRDLVERKVTLPLLHALQRLPELHGALADAAPGPAEVRELVEVIRASGALDAALGDAAAYATEAVASLRALPPSEARDALEVLALHVVERSR